MDLTQPDSNMTDFIYLHWREGVPEGLEDLKGLSPSGNPCWLPFLVGLVLKASSSSTCRFNQAIAMKLCDFDCSELHTDMFLAEYRLVKIGLTWRLKLFVVAMAASRSACIFKLHSSACSFQNQSTSL
jgi:hypothetical protein